MIDTKIGILAAAFMCSAFFFDSTDATVSGRLVEYAGGGQGKVTFDGRIHAEQGFKCPTCHPKIWAYKRGQKMKMSEMNEGKFCGTCHNGIKAFSTKDEKNCGKCHKK